MVQVNSYDPDPRIMASVWGTFWPSRRMDLWLVVGTRTSASHPTGMVTVRLKCEPFCFQLALYVPNCEL